MVRRGGITSVVILLFFCQLSLYLYPQGLERLVDKTAHSILEFFKDQFNIRTSVVKFENFSGYSDTIAQKYYQLLVAKLESSSQIAFNDIMINFSRNKGEFNLNRIDKLNYLVYIKLIRNREKLGVGAAIFSRSLDKIVYVKYFEEPLDLGERDILNTLDYGFKTSGFSMVMEIEAKRGLLDCKTIKDLQGEERCYFYYPEEIEIYRLEVSNFKKFFSFKLEWGRPYFPTMQPEGRLYYFYRDKVLYLTLGSNFSPFSRSLVFRENQWQELEGVPFVPFKLIQFNQDDYLAGARYEEGKNYFKGKIILAPFQPQDKMLIKRELYEKSVPPFYSLAFSTHQGELDSIHLIDRDYNYRYFAADFEERTVEEQKRGSVLSALNGEWLAVSDFSTGSDKLYFYKIDQGSRQLVFENQVEGEILFISEGAWKSQPGFWVYVKQRIGGGQNGAYRLQFWSKSSE